MLFLRAFPFSFAILWRYLLVLPIMVISLMVFAAVAVLCAFLVGFVAPFLMALFIFAFGLAAGGVPIMVGMRVGLQACDIRPRNSYFGLTLIAIGYGFIEALCVLLIVSAVVALFVLLTPLGLADLMALTSAEDAVILANLLEASQFLTLMLLSVGGGLIVALRAALLVPFAGASVGRDADGRAHTPFYGFGSNFWSMFALVVVSYVGTALAAPIVILATAPFGISDRLLEASSGISAKGGLGFSEFFATFGTDGLIVVGLIILLGLWFFIVQCAGAVLAFLQTREDSTPVPEQKEAEPEVVEMKEPEPPMGQTDLLALMRSRMPTKGE